MTLSGLFALFVGRDAIAEHAAGLSPSRVRLECRAVQAGSLLRVASPNKSSATSDYSNQAAQQVPVRCTILM